MKLSGDTIATSENSSSNSTPRSANNERRGSSAFHSRPAEHATPAVARGPKVNRKADSRRLSAASARHTPNTPTPAPSRPSTGGKSLKIVLKNARSESPAVTTSQYGTNGIVSTPRSAGSSIAANDEYVDIDDDMNVDMSYDDHSSPHTPVGRPITAGKRPAPAEWDTHQPHPKRSNPTPHQSQASPGQRDSAKDYSIDVADADTSPSASNELESISSSGMEPSSTRTGRGRGRGRGKGFSRRRKPPGEASTRVWRPKKKSLHTILTKIINYVTL